MQKYPGFADRIHEGLVDIFGEKGRFVCSLLHLTILSSSLTGLDNFNNRNIITHHAEDGSGVGSAIIAG